MLVAAAEVRRADLEDQVAAVAVVRRQRALAGVLQQPASAAPRLSASIAFADSDPKLIPEMLTTDAGLSACRRPRAAAHHLGGRERNALLGVPTGGWRRTR